MKIMKLGVMDIEKRKTIIGSGMIIVSSILWGTALLYTQYILDNGMESKDMVSLKMLFGFITMLIYILIKDKDLFKIDKRGIHYSAIIGFICHALYNLFMFRAVEKTSISTTVTLLYTSPVFVMIISKIFFKEKITKNKILSLISCVIGCYLTVTGGNLKSLDLNIGGIFCGLASGLCYGTMTIINKAIVDDYEEVTILIYTFGFAFLFSLSFSNPLAIFQIEFNPLVYLFIIMLGVLSTAVSYLLYIKGLFLGVESSKAAIMATLEVPVSIIGSVIIFNQQLSTLEIIGVVLVLLSVLIINRNIGKIQRLKNFTS